MSVPQLAAYTFLPWVQGGVGRSIAAADEPGAALSARVMLPVTVRVDGAGDVPATVRLYGPGDVTGLDPAQIVRCDPPPGTSRFEAGYLPQVQFARADLPWLFTPAAPGTTKTRLRPWLVLVTVRRQDGVRLAANPRRLPAPCGDRCVVHRDHHRVVLKHPAAVSLGAIGGRRASPLWTLKPTDTKQNIVVSPVTPARVQ